MEKKREYNEFAGIDNPFCCSGKMKEGADNEPLHHNQRTERVLLPQLWGEHGQGGITMCGQICGDNRFEIIAEAKRQLLEYTNIETSLDEMKVIDTFLFRCWQMGWLECIEVSENG